jgi:hypothetical protein
VFEIRLLMKIFGPKRDEAGLLKQNEMGWTYGTYGKEDKL